MLALSTVVVTAIAACVVPKSETALQVTLPYEAFDSHDGPYGWRALNGAGCTDAALAQISAYANANQSRLNLEQQLELAFHSGQVLAFAGKDREAIPYFERAHNTKAPAEWRTYVAATLAFMRRDAAALAAAKDSYAALAPNSMRRRTIEGFVACINKPYSKAVHCRM